MLYQHGGLSASQITLMTPSWHNTCYLLLNLGGIFTSPDLHVVGVGIEMETTDTFRGAV